MYHIFSVYGMYPGSSLTLLLLCIGHYAKHCNFFIFTKQQLEIISNIG